MRWTSYRALFAALALVAAGCPPADGDDDSAGDDDTVDDDSTGDDDTTDSRLGLSGRSGEATVDVETFAGFEEMYFVADQGLGDDVCRVHYDLTSTGVRDDCDDCDWAFDLVSDNAAIVAESDVGCSAVFGIDAANVGELDGTTVSYGYIAEYFGHASVLTQYTQGGSWEVVGFAAFDGATGALEFDLEDGFFPY